MPQPCKICRHPERQAIDGLLLDGGPSLREIGAQHGISKDSLLRHWQRHVAGEEASEDCQPVEAPDDPAPNDRSEARQDAEDSPLINNGETTERNDEARQAVEGPSAGNSGKTAERGNEARQKSGEARQTSAIEAQDVEALYQAFLERWRGRLGIKADEIAAWPDGERLLQAALWRGDLCTLGAFYCASARIALQFLVG